MTRVALLGYGLAGRVIHAPLLVEANGLRVTHVVTGDPGRAAQARADRPGAQVLPDAEALWARADVDLVVVAAPHAAHAGLAARALRLGLPTVVDKPLAATAAEADDLVALADREGVPLSVFANRRWDSDTLTAQALLADGVLGPVHRLTSRFTRFRPQVQERWREDPAALGGLLLDLGPHVVDQALLLLGPAVQVWAEVRRVRPGAQVEDDVLVALEHASGAVSHLHCSMAAPYAEPRLVLQGERAGWAKDELDGQEAAQRDGRPAGSAVEAPGRLTDERGTRPVASVPGDWGAYYRQVVAALRGEGALPVAAADGAAVLRVLEAAAASARERRVVRLDPPAGVAGAAGRRPGSGGGGPAGQ